MTKLFATAARVCALIGMALAMGAAAIATATASEPQALLDTTCNSPPRINCPQSNCVPELQAAQGITVEPKSGRMFFLDFPCDYKTGQKVILLLSLHGAGSIGNWQRHYFPAIDGKEKYRLVVVTPTALTATPTRTWQAQADDQYLQDVSDLVIKAIGKKNIKSFWLAGHSQGGITGRRLVCSPYFRDKLDGFLSLSGGRIGNPAGFVATGAGQGAPGGARGATPPGGAAAGAGRGGAAAAGRAGAGGPPPATPGAAPARAGVAGPVAAAGRGGPAAAPAPLDCDFSFIYSQGELEGSVSPDSTWAQKYNCGPRTPQADVVDTQPGYVTATDQTRGPGWGRFARPGTAHVSTYPNCKGGRIVADVVRLDKGHTEGYEPHILDKILSLIASAPGGKLNQTKG